VHFSKFNKKIFLHKKKLLDLLSNEMHLPSNDVSASLLPEMSACLLNIAHLTF